MITAILINNEVSFTKDEDLIITNELASYEEVLEELACGCYDGEEYIRVKEGIMEANEDDIELVMKI